MLALQPKSTLLLLLLAAALFPVPAESGLLRALVSGVQHIHEVRQHIHEVITSVGADPNSLIIAKFFPEAAQLISRDAVRLAQCYNGTVNGVTVSIFEQPVGTIIVEYLKHDIRSIEDIRSITAELLKARVIALLNSIKTLARHVIDCVVSGDKATVKGLTKFAEMSGEEVRETYMQPLGSPVGVEEDIPEVKKDDFEATAVEEAEANLGDAKKLVEETVNAVQSPGKGKLTLGRSNGQQLREHLHKNSRFSVERRRKYPIAFDYRAQGAVGPVKDQGTCGLCFLFGTMAAIESSYMLKHGVVNASFSETDLVDCMVQHSKYPGTAQKRDASGRAVLDVLGTPQIVPSCRPGGALVNVLREASVSGLTLLDDESHHYEPDHRWGQPFVFKPESCGVDRIVTKVTGWATQKNIQENEEYLKGVLIKYGPIATVFRTSLMIDRKYADVAGYIDGFFLMVGKMHDACDADTSANHVMTIVGWDEDYWILKNSYGDHKPGEGTETYKKPWGLNGWLYLDKKLATGCGLFGPGSQWFFPEVE